MHTKIPKECLRGVSEGGKGVICVFFWGVICVFFFGVICVFFSFLGLKSQEMASYAQVIE